jgi:hypothetical protein
MNDREWESKLKGFLKKTQSELQRAGNDIREEANKLIKEVQDPQRQAKVKAGLKDFGSWARKTAEEVATLVEDGVKKAEGAINKATDRVTEFATKESAPKPDPTPPNAKSGAGDDVVDEAFRAEAPKKPSKKTMGGKKKSGGPAKPKAAKKTIGKTPANDEAGE